MPDIRDMFYCANRGENVGAQLPSQPWLNVYNMVLRMPTYILDDEMVNAYSERQKSNTIQRKYFNNYNIIKSPYSLTPNQSNYSVILPGALGRHSKYVIIGFKQENTELNLNGNIHNWFNPQLTSIRLQIGNNSFIPYNQPFDENPSYYRYLELYKELIYLQTHCNVEIEELGDKQITYDEFYHHKFLVAFKVDSLPPDLFNMLTNTDITINYSTTTINAPNPTSAYVASQTGDIIRNPYANIILYQDQTDPAYTLNIPNTNPGVPYASYNVYALIIQESAVDIKFSDLATDVLIRETF